MPSSALVGGSVHYLATADMSTYRRWLRKVRPGILILYEGGVGLVFLGRQVSTSPSELGFSRRPVHIMHRFGVRTQVTLDCGSGARHYGTPDAHCTQAPDVLVSGFGLVPLG